MVRKKTDTIGCDIIKKLSLTLWLDPEHCILGNYSSATIPMSSIFPVGISVSLPYHVHTPISSLSIIFKKITNNKIHYCFFSVHSSYLASFAFFCIGLLLTLIFLLIVFNITSQLFEFLFLPYFLQLITLSHHTLSQPPVITVKVDSITNQPR